MTNPKATAKPAEQTWTAMETLKYHLVRAHGLVDTVGIPVSTFTNLSKLLGRISERTAAQFEAKRSDIGVVGWTPERHDFIARLANWAHAKKGAVNAKDVDAWLQANMKENTWLRP